MTELHLIKKYPNRRLYDTHRSRYIVLADIRAMIREGTEVRIVDSQSGEELTRNILLQIVADREAGTDQLLTQEVLIDLIRCRDDLSSEAFCASLESVLQPFLEPEPRPRHDTGGPEVAVSRLPAASHSSSNV